jgi:hypothetical protein
MGSYICPVFQCGAQYRSLSWYEKHMESVHPNYRPRVSSMQPKKDVGNNFNLSSEVAASFWNNNQLIPIPADDPSDSESVHDQNTTTTFNGAAASIEMDSASDLEASESPFYPFASEEEYNLAEWFIESNTAAKRIDNFFKTSKGLDSSFLRTFTSSYTFRQQIDKMSDGLGWESWQIGETRCGWSEASSEPIQYYYRDILKCMEWLLSQPCHAAHLVYAPMKEYAQGRQIYSEMHTANWWWDVQVAKKPSRRPF